MRSTYAIYNYVGLLLKKSTDIDNLQAADESGSGGFINVQIGNNNNGDCFAEVTYKDVDYCVLNKATNTKQLFTLLHQLQQLQTAPANTGAPLITIPAS